MAAKKKVAPSSGFAHPATPAVTTPTTASGARALPPNLPQDVEVELSVELGRHTLTLDQALALGEQSLFELDKMVGEPVEVKLNGKPFARGEVVTVKENFAVRLTEILNQQAG